MAAQPLGWLRAKVGRRGRDPQTWGESAGYGDFAGEIEIWIAPLSGEAPVRLWQDPAREPQRGAAWSPDGNWIADYSSRDGKAAILKIRVGANAQLELVALSTLLWPARWSPRGDWIAFDDAPGLRLVSPDGKRKTVISPHHWLTYGWSNDGTSLDGIAPDENRRLTLARLDAATGRETKIRDLGPLMAAMDFANFGRGLEYRGFSMNPDGKSFLTAVYRAKMNIWLLEDFDESTRLIDWLFRRQ